MTDELLTVIKNMKDDESLNNYVIAGLSSTLLTKGTVRIFEGSRHQEDAIAIHTHRYNFSCIVLRGTVTQNIFTQSDGPLGQTFDDKFQVTKLKYDDEPGKYARIIEGEQYFSRNSTVYSVGEVYSMEHNEFHSIVFSKDAIVLFFEEESCTNESYILDPILEDGTVVNVSETQPWMFQKKDS